MPEKHKTTAEELIGKHVLVDITRVDHTEKVIAHQQVHGRVTAIDNCIHIRLATGEDYKLPPDPGAFLPAAPGEYRLHSTDEIVVNPDFTSIWTVKAPPPGGKPASARRSKSKHAT